MPPDLRLAADAIDDGDLIRGGAGRRLAGPVAEGTPRRGVLPLGAARPILGGVLAVAFLIAAGDYVTPRFVGGPGTAAMIGADFIEQQFSLRFDWPMGSAMIVLRPRRLRCLWCWRQRPVLSWCGRR